LAKTIATTKSPPARFSQETRAARSNAAFKRTWSTMKRMNSGSIMSRPARASASTETNASW
jgi:hypothetical protein